MSAPVEIEELRAEISALKIAITVALNLLPDQQAVADRLRSVEELARRENLDTKTIAVLKVFREAWSI